MAISNGFENDLVQEILAHCYAKGWRIAVAESCTGGLLGAALTRTAGSSDVFDRGYVTYSNVAKTEMLGVSVKSLVKHGAVSPEVAKEMADGALKAANVDFAISITGIAGPGGSENKPEGRVCFGLAIKNEKSQAMTHEFGPLGRDEVRQASVVFALNLLAEAANATS